MFYIENRTYDALQVGETAELTRVLHAQDIAMLSEMTGEANPMHLDGDLAASDGYQRAVAHGMWGGTLISALIGTELPGPGSVQLSQSLDFLKPIEVNDTVTVRVTVAEKHPGRRVTLACECLTRTGETAIAGTAEVIAPEVKLRRPRTVPAEARLHTPGAGYRRLIDACTPLKPLPTAVVHPCDALSLKGAIEAADQGLIVPVLVGPVARIRKVALAESLDLGTIEIVDTPHSHASAAAAVALARAGRVGALMKGALHTDELMAAVVDAANGLRTERRITHVFVLDVPHYPRPLFITDAAINIEPSLEVKRDIVQNAIDLAHALATPAPRVAILSAVETVTPSIRSTLDAAALCKMADRGQITGGLVDGPLAFDNAISAEAARSKGIVSQVAGRRIGECGPQQGPTKGKER